MNIYNDEYLYFILIISFLIGSSIGSFINNLGLRISDYIDKNEVKKLGLKKELFLLTLGNNPKFSICPICDNKLKWWMNIPIFSWIFLQGKCGWCKTKIPVIYLISEFFFGIMFVFLTYININNILFIFVFNLVFTLIYLQILIYKTNKYKKNLLSIILLLLINLFVIQFFY